METANYNKTCEKPVRANTEMYVRYQDIKTHLVLYLFIALEWITGPLKNKESRYTTGIGLS
jgi:hypothetical protein